MKSTTWRTPFSNDTSEVQPSELATRASARRSITSLRSGRTRTVSWITRSSRPSTRPTTSTNSPTLCEHQEAPNRVRHVEQVTSRLEGAEPHRLRVAQSLGHNCGDDRPLRLPGTESVKRSHHAHRCLERAMVTQCQLIGADFCRRVR